MLYSISAKEITKQTEIRIDAVESSSDLRFYYRQKLLIRFIIAQSEQPKAVGITAAATAHFICPLSFFTDINVVAQGQ